MNIENLKCESSDFVDEKLSELSDEELAETYACVKHEDGILFDITMKSYFDGIKFQKEREKDEFNVFMTQELADKNFLKWVYERFIHVHNEDENYDYMHKLKRIVDHVDKKIADNGTTDDSNNQ